MSIVLTTSCFNPPYNFAHTSTLNAVWRHRYNAAKKKANRPHPQPPHRRGIFHRRLQPLTQRRLKPPLQCGTKNRPPLVPVLTTSLCYHFLRHHFPSSLPLAQPRFIITSLLHHFPSSPLSFFTTSLPHHFPSSAPTFITTFLLHLFPLVTTSLPHPFPSSSLPILTTSLRHHPVS